MIDFQLVAQALIMLAVGSFFVRIWDLEWRFAKSEAEKQQFKDDLKRVWNENAYLQDPMRLKEELCGLMIHYGIGCEGCGECVRTCKEDCDR